PGPPEMPGPEMTARPSGGAGSGRTGDAAVRVERLRSEIRRHQWLYYSENRPEISDEAFDALERELIELERHHPELITPDSPTQRVGGAPTEEFPTVAHSSPMLSLENAYTEEEVREFDARLKRFLALDVSEPLDYASQLKIDGVSLALVWREGRLEQAI